MTELDSFETDLTAIERRAYGRPKLAEPPLPEKVPMEKNDGRRLHFHRRELLVGAAYLTLGLSKDHATIIVDRLPWTPNAGNPPTAALRGPWKFFTGDEGSAIEALADCIIPPDPQTPGGKDSGSAIFIDRQLAGPYGRQDGLYVRPPFMKGTRSQGHQSEKGPAQEYREGLAALDRTCKLRFGGKAFGSPTCRTQTRMQS